MKNQVVTCILAIYTLIWLQGCATRATETGEVAASDIPELNPALDNYIAWVPRNGAQTPAVAMALTHISMGYAKEQAALRFCGDGVLMDDAVTEQVGPIAAIAPETIGGYPAWYYRVSLRPGLHGCEQVSPPQLYRAIQYNLPEWMRLEMAAAAIHGPATLVK